MAKLSFNKQSLGRGLAVVVMLAGIFGLFFVLNYSQNSSLTGNVILNLDPEYSVGEPLNGEFSIVISEGELIPADSILSVNSGNLSKEYVLRDVVSNSISNGDFYLDSSNIKGNGEGYGKPGEIETNSEIDFTLKITKEVEESANENQGNKGNSENNGKADDNETTSESVESNLTVNSEESDSVEGVEENSVETESEETAVEEPEENNIESEEPSIEETASEETTNEVVESENSDEGDSLITEGLTGNAVKESKEVKGKVSKDSPYSYDLEEGESAEISESSGSVNLKIEDGKVIVSTESSEVDSGFGKKYVDNSDGNYEINIDLSKIDFIPEEDNLEISLSYNGEEIFSNTITLSESSEIEEEVEETELPETNITTNVTSNVSTNVSTNTTNITKTQVDLSDYSLSEDEKAVIKIKTGKDQVDIVKSEVSGENLVIKFQIGKYWSEKSYDYSLSQDIVENQIEKDRAKFVKYLARSLSESENSKVEEVEDYIGNYSI